MGSYEDAVRTLEVELRVVEQAFRDLTHEQWQTPTKLQPLDETQPHRTLFELAGHFDHLHRPHRVADGRAPGRPGRPRPHKFLHLPALRGRTGARPRADARRPP
jgi:hypothetical protein